MAGTAVTGVRGVELGVRDLDVSAQFYSKAWGLEPVAADADTVYLRAMGREHHSLTLRRRSNASLLGARFAAEDKAAVDRLHAAALAMGVAANAPHDLPVIEGGGYGFDFHTPDGIGLSVSTGVAQHAAAIEDRTRPAKFSHVVFRATQTDASEAFFCDLLGFKVTDRTDMLHFLRCTRDHHSVALARVTGPGLHHFAFELPDIDSLMRATGRVKLAGHDVEWGTGRHAGPGNNVYSVFVEPDGFAVELTTEMDQIDESYPLLRPREYWRTRPLRPCSWGTSIGPTKRAQDAQLGVLTGTVSQTCTEAITQRLAS